MADDLTVTPDSENGVVVLKIDYSADFLGVRDAKSKLKEEFIKAYKAEMKASTGLKTKSCIVNLEMVTVAGSSVARALFELWKIVNYEYEGTLYVAAYPQDYQPSLTALGVTTLKRFELVLDEAEALKEVL
ncbi:MAG: hypothetical protein O7G83_15425 [Proteobacteria bacterium]|nr:hypothetical protein [Pseudomonadota bacterium]